MWKPHRVEPGKAIPSFSNSVVILHLSRLAHPASGLPKSSLVREGAYFSACAPLSSPYRRRWWSPHRAVVFVPLIQHLTLQPDGTKRYSGGTDRPFVAEQLPGCPSFAQTSDGNPEMVRTLVVESVRVPVLNKGVCKEQDCALTSVLFDDPLCCPKGAETPAKIYDVLHASRCGMAGCWVIRVKCKAG